MRYTVWGFVYLFSGHAKCLLSDKRTTPHFLFYTNRRIGVATAQLTKQMKYEKYVAPEAEVLEIVVEKGFADSQLENPGSEEGKWD